MFQVRASLHLILIIVCSSLGRIKSILNLHVLNWLNNNYSLRKLQFGISFMISKIRGSGLAGLIRWRELFSQRMQRYFSKRPKYLHESVMLLVYLGCITAIHICTQCHVWRSTFFGDSWDQTHSYVAWSRLVGILENRRLKGHST